MKALSAPGKGKAWCRWLLVFSVCLITVASVMPYGSAASTVSVVSVGLDKVLHFMGFACVILFTFGAGKEFSFWYGMRAVTYVLIFSAHIEFVQYYIPYRTFNPVDIIANLFGILFGVLLWTLVRGRWRYFEGSSQGK